MTNRHAKGNRDANEPLFVEIMQRKGQPAIELKEGQGADWLLLTTPPAFLEIKNPEQPPNKRQLTDCEKKLQAECAERGIGYLVYEQPEQLNEYLVRCRV